VDGPFRHTDFPGVRGYRDLWRRDHGLRDGDPPLDTIGTLMPEKEIKIADPETMEELPPGSTGELVVSSRLMIEAYWNKEDETRDCFVEIDGKLWYRTGDLVRVDEQGYMYFVDRTADIIKHKGYRISASEIEAAIKDHPAAISSCVVGVPDERVGERIKAFVVLKEDARGITGSELIRLVQIEDDLLQGA